MPGVVCRYPAFGPRAGPLRPIIEGLLTKEPERRLSAEAARAAMEPIQSRAGDSTTPIEDEAGPSQHVRRDRRRRLVNSAAAG